MKKLLMTILFSLLITVNLFAQETESSNLDGIMITPIFDTSDGIETKIKYKDGFEESISTDYVALFVNGSIIREANIITKENRTLLPVRKICECLGCEVKWLEETGEIEINNDKNTVKLKAGSRKAVVNGEEIMLDAVPEIHNGFTYVPVRFLAEVFNYKVDYCDGVNLETTHIFPRIPQVIISSYDNYRAISKDEAVETVKEQLIKAYELTYGEYKPWTGNEVYENNGDDIRKAVFNLEVTDENDRFYTIPVVFDFWVDKYTGEVYVFYNGMTMTVYKFDPESKGALSFAG